MHDKFVPTNSLTRHSVFLVFRSININLEKSEPHINSTPHDNVKIFFLLTLIFFAAYSIQSFERSAHSTVNIVLVTYCSAGLNEILPPQSFLMSLMTTLQICLYLFWKFPGKVYNASHHLRVLGLVSDLIFQNPGHLIEEVNRFHNFDFHIFFMFFGDSDGENIGWVLVSSWGEWPSGLRRCNQNWKVPGSNPARHSARPKDPTSLHGSWWPSGGNS